MAKKISVRHSESFCIHLCKTAIYPEAWILWSLPCLIGGKHDSWSMMKYLIQLWSAKSHTLLAFLSHKILLKLSLIEQVAQVIASYMSNKLTGASVLSAHGPYSEWQGAWTLACAELSGWLLKTQLEELHSQGSNSVGQGGPSNLLY